LATLKTTGIPLMITILAKAQSPASTLHMDSPYWLASQPPPRYHLLHTEAIMMRILPLVILVLLTACASSGKSGTASGFASFNTSGSKNRAPAQNEQLTPDTSKNWRPVVDNAKCAAAAAYEIPTLLGLGITQLGAGISDLGASILEGRVCINASKLGTKVWRPVIQSLIEMGCVAPMGDIENPKYYTYAEMFSKSPPPENAPKFPPLFHCE
jgi:hypothetical protein